MDGRFFQPRDRPWPSNFIIGRYQSLVSIQIIQMQTVVDDYIVPKVFRGSGCPKQPEKT